ncbi:Mu transposase C-terminal domain-containing protein [Paenibacillus protaetiae]|nr:Mu transposase C-terminal domain-containing protein [Paenibacillus protaetiae]
MGRISLGSGAKFLFDDRSFVIMEELEEDNFECKNLASGRKKVFPKQFFYEALEKGEIVFSEEGKNTTEEVIRKNIGADFSKLPDKQKDLAKFRLFAIEPLLALEDVKSLNPYVDARLAELNDGGYHHKGYNFSRASIYRWFKDYKQSNCNIWSLVAIYDKCGPKGKLINREVELIIQKMIDQYYKRREAVNPKDIHELVIYEIDKINEFRIDKEKLEYPSRATVYRRVQGRDQEDIAKSKKGGRFSYMKYLQVKLQKKPDRPLQRVEIDHTLLDLFLVDEEKKIPLGRPTVTTLLDVFSGYPLGVYFGFEPPSYTAIMHALRHAISPKNYIKELYPEVENPWLAYGLPDLLVTDRGKDFMGDNLEDACAQLNIKLEHLPGKRPWYKGAVERHFRTINQSLIHKIPGTTFSNIFEKGDYDPKKNAVMSLSQFLKVFHIWLLDYYAQDTNKGVRGIPSKIWESGIKTYGEPDIPTSKLQWEIALMKMESRTIQRHGIRMDNLFYQSPALHTLLRKIEVEYRNKDVDIKYDPSDLGKIYVYDPFEKTYFDVPCTNQEYALGLNEYAHKVYQRIANAEFNSVDLSALARAKKKVTDIIFDGKSFVGKIGRLLGVGSNQVFSDKPVRNQETVPSKSSINKNINIFEGVDTTNWRATSARKY